MTFTSGHFGIGTAFRKQKEEQQQVSHDLKSFRQEENEYEEKVEKSRNFYCMPCGVSCSNQQEYEEHVYSQKHRVRI